MKNVVIISSSPRANGNSASLAHEFERGAKENNSVSFIDLSKEKLNYCLGCYACTKNGRCFQNDGFNEILTKVLEADVLVLATPVYFYSMCGQMKVFIDRLVTSYTNIRADIYLIITAWDDNENNLKSTIEALRGLTRDCLEGCPEKGILIGGGLEKIDSLKKHPEYLKEAYLMGKNC